MKIYDDKIDALKKRKLEQTQEKIRVEGLLDEDDYGRIVPPADLWNIIPNHTDGSFYGFEAWTDNFCSLMDTHPVYIDPDDAFAARWMYFMSKMRPNKWNPDYPYDHLKSEFNKYDIIHGIGEDAHFAPDYKMGLELGWEGLLEKIDHYRKINTSDKQQDFYNYHERAIRSIQGWIERHVEKGLEMAGKESDPVRKQNLLDMAEVNKNLVTDAPKTFREACQWIIWYHLASRTYNRDGAGGQIDTLLQPFYENDIKSGLLNDKMAVYFLACFLINDPIYWQLGGPDDDGNDVTSKISFLILEAADKINTSLNITIRVHENLNQELFDKAVGYLVKNKNGWPRFSGDKALVKGFMKNGCDKSLAIKRIAVGCNWMSLPGMEYTLNDLVKINMAKVFEVSYNELNHSPLEKNSDNLWSLFSGHLTNAVKATVEGMKHHLKYQKYNEPELLLNLLSHGPIEKGCDVSDGGAMYYNLAIDGAGLAIVADSFAALEQRVEQEQRLTWDQIRDAVVGNFTTQGGEYLRALLQNSQRYGQSGSLGEKWAIKIRDLFVDLVRSQSDPNKKYNFIPGFFSWANTVGFGKNVGATPNGRKAQAPISHGANPNPGFAIDDASLSLAKTIALIQPDYGNTAPMQWELDPSLANTEQLKLIGAVIKAHFELGGTLINVNIMDKETVLNAHKNPELYPELVVRITGFTAYFSMLSPEFRQLVVDRILEN